MGKKLGQHFLKSQKVVNDIIDVGNISADDVVLEIGPGKGILTKALLEKAKKVIAVEKSRGLVEYLKKRFAKEIQEGKLELIEKDILDFDIQYSGYKLVANIPYYITGEILRKFLSAKYQPRQMVLLVQKEVAERIIGCKKISSVQHQESHRVRRGGSPGVGRRESILSISVKAYGTPRYIKTVPARFFSPPPKVNSAIISIENISRDFFRDIDEEKFFKLVRAGFTHRRKLLFKNLKEFLERTEEPRKTRKLLRGRLKNRRTEELKNRRTKERLKEIFEECGISEKARAEDLTVEDWRCLFLEVESPSSLI